MRPEVPLEHEPKQDLEHRRPLQSDTSAFGQWLRRQGGRRDPVGALATMALKDPRWPAGADRGRIRAYFREHGARPVLMQTLAQAFDEFDKDERKARTRSKNKAARAARRKNRKKKK